MSEAPLHNYTVRVAIETDVALSGGERECVSDLLQGIVFAAMRDATHADGKQLRVLLGIGGWIEFGNVTGGE